MCQLPPLEARRLGSHAQNEVARRKPGADKPETFPGKAPYQIAIDRTTQEALCHHQTKACPAFLRRRVRTVM